MFLGDRRVIFPGTQTLQPFRADETEQLGVLIELGATGAHVMQLAVFGTKSSKP
jgi:hypothetical protein